MRVNMSDQQYPIIDISHPPHRAETVGRSRKEWYLVEGSEWLLKYPRSDTGEHWAEKVAAEVGTLIGVDTANVELARVEGQLATICRSFLPDVFELPDPAEPSYELHHGREFLGSVIPDYDLVSIRPNTSHNIKNIVRAILELTGDGYLNATPDSGVAAFETLASYAVLDGLIGNTDRHHENWMLLLKNYENECTQLRILPSFDHASSLGRELRDERRERILASNGILNYLTHRKVSGGVYVGGNRSRAPSPLRLAQLICRWRPELGRFWADRLSAIPIGEFRSIIDRVPDEFMSDPAREFAYQILIASRAELLRSTG